jgi:nickel-dependent lactate racemase
MEHKKQGIYFAEGSPDRVIDSRGTSELVDSLIAGIEETHGPLRRVLLVPPDITRLHSGAGELTTLLYGKLSSRAHVEIMPAVGTHFAMTPEQISAMYPGIPLDRFKAHRWRHDVVPMGDVPESLVEEISEGRLRFPITSAVNRSLVEGDWDRIISIGQLVPHELAGIANFSKNILIGVGGPDTIAKSHYLAAVYGLERLMGQIDSPMRRILSYMEAHCIADLPITYLMTVRGTENGSSVTRGLFAGETSEVYEVGARLCQRVSITKVARRAKKVVAYMDPQEYHSTWVGNKSIYRTRMVVADGGELVVIAPGIRQFGEDPENDALIRRVGYRSTEEMINLVDSDPSVAANLTAVSHIIVSSPEDRFRITYAPGKLSRNEVEAARFTYADPGELLERYDPEVLSEGWNTLPDGEEIFFVPQPASGLWMGA